MLAELDYPRTRRHGGSWFMAEAETFGAWLKRNRTASRYSMRDIAKEIQRSHTYIQKLEEDDSSPEEITPRPPIAIIERMATLFGTDASEAKRLAGYPVGQKSLIRELPPGALRVAEIYGGASEEGQKLMDATAEAVQKAFSRDSIGKRSE